MGRGGPPANRRQARGWTLDLSSPLGLCLKGGMIGILSILFRHFTILADVAQDNVGGLPHTTDKAVGRHTEAAVGRGSGVRRGAELQLERRCAAVLHPPR
eukprot:EG_transcript_14250